ncbi:MAG: T9SS type A sorting domain-containing protein [Bacteroidales bacterium]|nr:T9SS type A sorting domain-containing protein [Bacteroidales bacterium]
MKRITFINLFILISIISISQNYTPIAENGNRFSIAMFSGGNPNPTHSNYEIIGEDTTINEIIYQKLYETEMNVEFSPSMTLIGFIRETEERQVFLRNLIGDEGLYYDFYVAIGDTINFYNPFISDLYQSIFPELGSDTLAIVDTVYYSEIYGVDRKIYEVCAYGDYGLSPLQFIEGTGAITGIKHCGSVHFFGVIGGSWTVLCAYHDYELFYQNETYSTCFITNIETSNTNSFEISPNPFDNTITINNLSLKECHIKIYDINGNVIFETFTNETISYNTHDLPSGMYIISINSDSQIQHYKLIKH